MIPLHEQLDKAKKEVERIEHEMQEDAFKQLVPILQQHTTLEATSIYTGILRVVCSEDIAQRLKALIQTACLTSLDSDRVKISPKVYLELDNTHSLVIYVSLSGKTANMITVLREELNKLQLKVSFQPILDSIDRDIRLKQRQSEQIQSLITQFQ